MNTNLYEYLKSKGFEDVNKEFENIFVIEDTIVIPSELDILVDEVEIYLEILLRSYKDSVCWIKREALIYYKEDGELEKEYGHIRFYTYDEEDDVLYSYV